MARAVELFLHHGQVKTGIWCDIHALPHILEYSVYSYCEVTPGNLIIRHVKDVKKCDTR